MRLILEGLQYVNLSYIVNTMAADNLGMQGAGGDGGGVQIQYDILPVWEIPLWR